MFIWLQEPVLFSDMSKLLLVPVPVGNISDITLRAKQSLQEADVIFCEDTRNTLRLLGLLGISGKKLIAYHQNNEHQMTRSALTTIRNCNLAALVSDAGTPAISDPGFLLVRECISEGISVEALPGPTAFVPALAASGLPCDRFYFEGFLPLKKGRQKQLAWLATLPVSIVLYEAPHRIVKLLNEAIAAFGAQRQACLCREISKMHEEFIRGSLAEIQTEIQSRENIKGEMVLVVGAIKRHADDEMM